MTVVGVGIDLVDVAAFGEQLDVPGTRFGTGVFTDRERASAHGRTERLAARWAAKEAFVKAWAATRFGQVAAQAEWLPAEIEVVTDAEGRPGIQLHGAVAGAVTAALGDDLRVHVSLSHDGGSATAVVVLDVGALDMGGTAR